MSAALRMLTGLLGGLLIVNVFGFLAAAAIGNPDAALDFAIGAVAAYAFLLAVLFVGELLR